MSIEELNILMKKIYIREMLIWKSEKSRHGQSYYPILSIVTVQKKLITTFSHTIITTLHMLAKVVTKKKLMMNLTESISQGNGGCVSRQSTVHYWCQSSESWASSSLFRTLVSHQFTVED